VKSLLIEQWLPFEELGVESRRENSTGQHPPPNRLHVWWARRPLTASRAAVLASSLPEWPKELREKFPTEYSYRTWFLHLLGILRDPIAANRALRRARETGERIRNPYGYPRAFTINPDEDQLKTLGDLLEYTWGERQITMLDPFAGGGSIPFEALRFGFCTIANELNPVAAVILKATLDYPARFGPELADDIRKWGDIWYGRVKEHLQPYFTPLPPGAEGAAYLWARTVACPETGKLVPLSPNWWLRKGDDPVAVKLIADPGMGEPDFEIVHGRAALASDPDEGTIRRGVGRSPWTGQAIPGEYIKTEAQAHRMGEMLYAVIEKPKGGFVFRPPREEDHAAFDQASMELSKRRSSWQEKGYIPNEDIPIGNKTKEPLRLGVMKWADMFSDRQLLSTVHFLIALGEVREEFSARYEGDYSEAIDVYLSFVFDKAISYNSTFSRFDHSRGIRNLFEQHNFSIKWSFSEFDASANLLPWSIEQVANSYQGIAELCTSQKLMLKPKKISKVHNPQVIQGDAADFKSIGEKSIRNITADPPYYDNVMYSELSDFFYVWLKKTLGSSFKDWFDTILTDKDFEAVANPARFEEFGRKKKVLAKQDYERKVGAAFREMYRILHPDGVFTVMFTHKSVEAWDTLATALLDAGFSIQSSWPVHTESQHSRHQAKVNAASSTIILACRKRDSLGNIGETVWWDDLHKLVRQTAREKAKEFAAQGVKGVDLYISVFGPTLSIISERWPVMTSEVDIKTDEPKVLRPETALDLAREEVLGLRREILLAGREVAFDAVTDWYLMAWDSFGAEQFPYDEARKLAIGVGVDLEGEVKGTQKLARKKGEYIQLLKPWERRSRGRVDEDVEGFPVWINAVHTAMMVYKEDGPSACEAFLRRSGLRNDTTFKALLQALLNAIPRRKSMGKFIRPEAEVLENMRLAFFDELVAPEEEEAFEEDAEQIILGSEFNEEGEVEDSE
jgi:putative DNA methylase